MNQIAISPTSSQLQTRASTLETKIQAYTPKVIHEMKKVYKKSIFYQMYILVKAPVI